MKFSILFPILSLVFSVSAEELKPQLADYIILSDTLSSDLDNNQAEVEFQITGTVFPNHDKIMYAVDYRENRTFDPAGGDPKLNLILTPRLHAFQFFYNSDYLEIEIDSLQLKDRHKMVVQLNFQPSQRYELVKKSVLYLYPPEKMDVTIEVLPQGAFTFTYPDISEGWNFTCSPDGQITDGKSSWPYLFWESEQEVTAEIIDISKGIVVPGTKAVAYLEQQLNDFGMTASEKADFITYWGPILQTKTNLYIYLLLDEECDAFASLKINPEPTHISRFYVIWSEVPAGYSPDLEPQKLRETQRDGFTVLEWGGVEIDAAKLLQKAL